MRNKILSIALILILSLSFFTGCSNFTPLTGGPALNDAVTSNGGAAVRKGDFLYFVNGVLN